MRAKCGAVFALLNCLGATIAQGEAAETKADAALNCSIAPSTLLNLGLRVISDDGGWLVDPLDSEELAKNADGVLYADSSAIYIRGSINVGCVQGFDGLRTIQFVLDCVDDTITNIDEMQTNCLRFISGAVPALPALKVDTELDIDTDAAGTAEQPVPDRSNDGEKEDDNKDNDVDDTTEQPVLVESEVVPSNDGEKRSESDHVDEEKRSSSRLEVRGEFDWYFYVLIALACVVIIGIIIAWICFCRGAEGTRKGNELSKNDNSESADSIKLVHNGVSNLKIDDPTILIGNEIA